MDEKKKNNLFYRIVIKIFIGLLVGFSVLYISEATGYYEFEQHKKVELTNELISQFEQDVKDGNDINVKDYIEETQVSYTNGASSIGYALSNQIGNIVQNGLNSTFKFLENLFGE
jgi:hypothetical protein